MDDKLWTTGGDGLYLVLVQFSPTVESSGVDGNFPFFTERIKKIKDESVGLSSAAAAAGRLLLWHFISDMKGKLGHLTFNIFPLVNFSFLWITSQVWAIDLYLMWLSRSIDYLLSLDLIALISIIRALKSLTQGHTIRILFFPSVSYV